MIKRLDAEEAGKLALKNPVKQDRGFKVLKLNKSNFRQWLSFASEAKPEHLVKQLSFHIDHVGHKATKEDLLYEILIKAGFKPTEKVEVLELKDGKLSRRDAETQRKEINSFGARAPSPARAHAVAFEPRSQACCAGASAACAIARVIRKGARAAV